MCTAIDMPQDKTVGTQRRVLLKEKLELEKVKTKTGQTRYTIKPIEDHLTFDKARGTYTWHLWDLHLAPVGPLPSLCSPSWFHRASTSSSEHFRS